MDGEISPSQICVLSILCGEISRDDSFVTMEMGGEKPDRYLGGDENQGEEE